MSSNNDGRREVTGLILFFSAVALTLMYYLPGLSTGTVGTFLRSIGFGLIGSAAFTIPLFLFYAAVDFFTEKRAGVAPLRVTTVIFIMVCVSSFLCLISLDFEYFKTLCTDDYTGKISALKSMGLLWRSGPDTSLIADPTASSDPLSGGLIGGLIAISLYTILGKPLSILAVIVMFLCLVILVFHVSLKKTAKKTAKAIKKAVSSQRRTGASYRGYAGSQAPYVDRNRSMRQPSSSSPFVNSPTQPYNVPIFDIEYGAKKDPFDRGMPVDGESGFIDVSGREFGAELENAPDTLRYGNRKVDTSRDADAPSADFGYGTDPKNPHLRPRRTEKKLSFLEDDCGQKDFYDLGDTDGGTVFPDAPSMADTIEGQYERLGEDDLPYEIDDDPYDYSDREAEQAPARKVRPARMRMEPAGSSIPVNNETGVDLTEGRIVETNSAPDRSSQAEPVPAARRKEIGRYIPPPLSLLAVPVQTKEQKKEQEKALQSRARELEETLLSFGINSKVINITHGPAITRFELTIEKGVKVSRVLALQDDIAMAMAAVSVRIEAPIPGKSAIGIEIPNSKVSAVHLRGLLQENEFKNAKPLEVPLGRDIPNRPIMCDLAKMPHLLIAGSTGSGKSVCINTILTSILYHSSPDEVKMILIDPKVVELSVYNGIPHLYMPVVTDPRKAANALKWAVIEMEKRYRLFAESSVRDLSGYNDYLRFNGDKPLPLVLIVIDELADLMTVASKDVEVQISRLAAMARAAGLHIIIATQRPSVDVLTGVIKANIPSRVAFAVSSGPDSRTILDSVGAEKLLGKGDMLYSPISAPKPIRGQGAYLSDDEVSGVVDYLKRRYGSYYDEDIMNQINSGLDDQNNIQIPSADGGSDEDKLIDDAVNVVIEAGSASVSLLQRRLGVGYPKAGKLIDALESLHVIGPFEGSKPRKVLISKTEWLEMKARGKK